MGGSPFDDIIPSNTPFVARSVCASVDRKMFLTSLDAHLKVLALSVKTRVGRPPRAANLRNA